MRNRKIAVVTTLLPPEQESPQKMLERLVRQRVDEILADRKDLLFRPFFEGSKSVTDQIHRIQNMAEVRKWSVYFDRHGCLICGTKRTTHAGSGTCSRCHSRTAARLKVIVSEGTRSGTRERFSGDLESIAKKALAGAIRLLPPAREGRP